MKSDTSRTPFHDRLERAFAAWTRAVLRFRFLVVAVVVALTAGLAHQAATKLRVDASTEGLLGSDSPSMRALDRLTESFGADRTIVLAIEGDVYSNRFLARLVRLHEALEAIELDLPSVGEDRRARREAVRSESPRDEVDPFASLGADDPFASLGEGAASESNEVLEDVTSLANAVDLGMHDGVLEARDLVATPIDAAAVKARVRAHPSLVPALVSEDGRMALVVVRPRAMDAVDLARVVDEVDRVARPFRAAGFVLSTSGPARLEVSLNRIMERDIGTVFGIALVAMIAVLAFLYRSVLGVVAPIVVIVLSVVATHGAMAMLRMPVTGITSVLGTMLLVIGMADAVHVVSAFRDRLRAGEARNDAIVRAVAATAWPITFTAITDVAGLASFRASDLVAIRDMGTAGSIGIFAALVYTLTLLPVLLSATRATPLASTPAVRATDLLDRVLDRCERLSRPDEITGSNRRRNRVLAVAAVLSLVFAYGATKTRSVHDPLDWLPESGAERQAVAALERHGFGPAEVSILVRGRPGHDLRDPALVRGLARFEADVRRVREGGAPLVTHVGSVLDLVRDANEALTGTAALPTDRAALSDVMTLVESASPRDLGRVATIDLRTTRMTLSLRWLESSRYGAFTEALERAARADLAGLADIEVTGSVYAGFDVITDLNGSLRASFGTAVLSIALTMILLVFSVRIGLLAMIPNLVPILGMLGTMGLFGLPLDLNGLLVGSIAMGLVVDDTIHVVHDFVRHRSLLGVEGAVRHVFLGTGRALVGTSVVLALGFGFFLAATLENVQRFGGLLALSILIAMVGDLLLTPAVLRCLRDERSP